MQHATILLNSAMLWIQLDPPSSPLVKGSYSLSRKPHLRMVDWGASGCRHRAGDRSRIIHGTGRAPRTLEPTAVKRSDREPVCYCTLQDEIGRTSHHLHSFLCIPVNQRHTFCLTINLRSATLTLFEQFVEKSSNRIRLSTLSETICLEGSTFSLMMPRE